MISLQPLIRPGLFLGWGQVDLAMQVDHEIMKVKTHVFLVQGLQHIVAVK